MEILITGRHVEVSEELRAYIQEKANKLTRYYDRIHEIEVVIHHASEQFTADMIVRVDQKHTFVASETGPDTVALIDIIEEKIERQLKKYKEKVRAKKGGVAADGGAEL